MKEARASAGPVDEAGASRAGPVPDPPVSRAVESARSLRASRHTRSKVLFDNFRNVVTTNDRDLK